MTANSYNQFRRSNAPRSTLPLERSSRPGPLGNASTRPPTALSRSGSLGTAPVSAPNPPVNAGAVTAAIDEANWFGTQDQAVAEENAGRSMAALVGRIIGAKPFPISARRLADLTRLDVVRIEPVIQVLESDPGLSARLLRLVNSAGYALRQRCTSVRHAATLVGTDRLHQIATTAAVLDLFDSKGPVAAQIIEHSTVVGAFCRYLGAHLALPVDDLFTAGFLHDIGKLMLMETEGEQYIELLTHCASQPDSIHLLERKLYGFDHAALAAHVLSAWNIPDPVPKMVGWHHEPAHALKTSSLMASLVQTIRLSDAIVYAMRQDPETTGAKDVAKHEAAGYLEISEPQLAAMWNELRVLYDECRDQCLGEHAPALDPRSLRPRQPLSLSHESTPSERAHDLPKQFPCVECGCPTFGNTCPACNGYVCPDHQVGNDAWCTICARDYKTEKKSLPVSARTKWVLAALGSAILLSGVMGMISSGSSGALRAGFGTFMLGLLAGLLYTVGRTWLFRTRFVRSRPNRFIAEPQLNDGGTQSLIPSMNPETDGASGEANGLSWLNANIHLVEPLKEITIREISGSAPASEAAIAMPPPPNAATAAPVPEPARQESGSVDPVRVQLQSESLVTLPAPAHDRSDGGTDAAANDESGTGRQRSPRDTLNEHDMARELGVTAAGQWPATAAEAPTPREMAPDFGSKSARKTDPGPEAQFARPLVTFRETESSALASMGARWENQKEDETQSRSAPTIPSDPMGEETEGSHASEIVVVAQPIVDISPREKATEALSSPLAEQPDAPSLSNDVAEVQESPAIAHPLAALGLCSQPPRSSTSNSVAAPPTEHSPVVTPRESVSPVPETRHSGPDAAENAAPENNQGTLAAETLPTQEELLKNLTGELVSRFGADFEAQVRELAAQRVAQLIAERFMAAFDVNTLLKEPARIRNAEPAETPEASTAAKPKRKRRQAS